jgi:hypothetical protein
MQVRVTVRWHKALTLLICKSKVFFCPVTQQPNSGPGHLIVEVSISHTPGRTPLSEWSARRRDLYLRNKHKKRTSIPTAGFEPTIPAIERLQIYALGRAATGLGKSTSRQHKFINQQSFLFTITASSVNKKDYLLTKLCWRNEKMLLSRFTKHSQMPCTMILHLTCVQEGTYWNISRYGGYPEVCNDFIVLLWVNETVVYLQLQLSGLKHTQKPPVITYILTWYILISCI